VRDDVERQLSSEAEARCQTQVSVATKRYSTSKFDRQSMIEDRDLAELSRTLLTGVTVGIGSLILVFVSGAQILVQCMFECIEGDITRLGHGEDPGTSQILFAYLNHEVESAVMDRDAVLTLRCENNKFLRIVPEQSGLESYVITTRHGIYPVAAH
jgi:hypothetical protein